jgi:hypothetical protein
MLRLYSNITINGSGGELQFDYVHEASTSESWANLTDYFTLSFPKNINKEGLNIFVGSSALLKRGDEVTVKHGYYPNLNAIFKGYITDIAAKIPLTIKCEDEMFLLKNTNIIFPTKRTVITSSVSKTGRTKRLKKPRIIIDTYSLDDLLDSILPDYIHYECLDMQLAKRAYTNVSVTRILDDLKSTYGLYSYFRADDNGDQILHVGFASDASTGNTVEFEFENNIIDDSNLEYQVEENIFIKVIIKVINENNEVTEYTYGDTDGSQRTVHLYSNTAKPLTKAEIDKAGAEWLNKDKYTGYKGSFTTFGEPYVTAGDIVKLTSKKLPERDGNYLVKEVKREWGMGGSRQEVYIDQKV